MYSRNKTQIDRWKIPFFIAGLFLINVIGSFYIYTFSKPHKIFYPVTLPLEVSWSVYPKKIQVTRDINQIEKNNLAYITYSFKNNMKDVTFDNIKIYIPNTEVNTIESPKARRNTNIPWRQPYGMFIIDKIAPNEIYTATISAFVYQPKIYTLTSIIVTEGNGKFTYNTPPISFTAQN